MTHNVEIVAFVASIGNVTMEPMNGYCTSEQEVAWLAHWDKWWRTLKSISRTEVDDNEVRCPDTKVAQKMREVIDRSPYCRLHMVC